MFEYDTEEEYQLYLSQALKAHQDLQKLKLEQYQTVKNSLEVIEKKPIKQELRLQELWQKFVIHEKRAGKELKQIEEYEPTFKKLREFYGDKKNMLELESEDIELFKEHLTHNIEVRGQRLSKKTVNKNLRYFRAILQASKVAELKQLAEEIEFYSQAIIKKESSKRENYTEEEIDTILNHSYNNLIDEAIIKIALYSGMRQGEIRRLSQEDIKQDKEGIYYFNITQAKSEAGKREIPIHNEILDLVLGLSFPLIPEMIENRNAFGKRVRKALYSAVDTKGKTFHTLRANFIDNIIDNNISTENPLVLHIIKEIVGHAEAETDRLTLKVYKKNFKLRDKNEVLNAVNYS